MKDVSNDVSTEKEARIGVYVCHCGTNIAATVDVEKVTKYAKSLSAVCIARNYQYMCSDPGQDLIKEDIKEYDLNGVVVAACSPRIHELSFRRVLKEAGLNPYCFEMANIREQCSWVHLDKKKATEKAKDLVKSAVSRANLLEPLEVKEVEVVPEALVIGGGVSGIYAALDLADKGFKVYLVEKSPTIGGHMAQLDKTFPTLDCSACILTPKMVEVKNHENIELLTNAEVTGIEGRIGNFEVKVKRKSRYVDEEKCRGCIADCSSACHIEVPDEFNAGIRKRKAIYIPFLQAVPLLATIDPEHCIGCRLCELACELDAIAYFKKGEEEAINVGAIIVATGFDLFDASKEEKYGYGVFDGVITGLEFERLCNASGPTQGKLEINEKKPKDVVFIQCVGSRERRKENGEGNKYCSRMCCMYTAKQAYLVKEKIPDATVTVFYTDVRAYGDGFEEFYVRVMEEGVIYKRRELEDPIEVVKKEDKARDRLEVRAWGKDYRYDVEADLVVLATGMVPEESTRRIADLLKIPRGEDGFLLEAHPKLRPVESPSLGIFLAGCCQSPKDIPDSVAQACGASAKVAALLSRGKVEIEPTTACLDENLCCSCRICEKICPYSAISFEEGEKGVEVEVEMRMRIDDVVCKGCGSCAAVCSSGAISMRHFKNEQIIAQIEAILS